jgi:hypothetical protein
MFPQQHDPALIQLELNLATDDDSSLEMTLAHPRLICLRLTFLKLASNPHFQLFIKWSPHCGPFLEMLCEWRGGLFRPVVDEGFILIVQALVAGLDLPHKRRPLLLPRCHLRRIYDILQRNGIFLGPIPEICLPTCCLYFVAESGSTGAVFGRKIVFLFLFWKIEMRADCVFEWLLLFPLLDALTQFVDVQSFV